MYSALKNMLHLKKFYLGLRTCDFFFFLLIVCAGVNVWLMFNRLLAFLFYAFKLFDRFVHH